MEVVSLHLRMERRIHDADIDPVVHQCIVNPFQDPR